MRGKMREFHQNEKDVILSLEKLKEICVSSFGISESQVNNDTNMDNVPGWDSLNHILFIIRVEKETGFKFKPSDIARSTSIKSILEIVNNR